MPSRTPIRKPKQPEKSNDEIYELVADEVLPRLKAVEEIAGESHRVLKAAKILNGGGEELFIKLMDEKSAEERLREALELVAANKAQVRAARAARRKWLARPKALAWAVVGGIASGVGYTLVVHP